MLNVKNKALVYHRGRWLWINDPLTDEESAGAVDRRQSMHHYRRRWWNLGPVSLYPNYTGILISTYAYIGTKNLPGFLVWIKAIDMSARFYAQDLPDLMEVLSLLAPIVLTGILTDVYQRSQKEG